MLVEYKSFKDVEIRYQLKQAQRSYSTQKPKEPLPPINKIIPLQAASQWLGNRMIEKNGMYYLDGLPASTDNLMRATNRILKNSGADQIIYNPAWEV